LTHPGCTIISEGVESYKRHLNTRKITGSAFHFLKTFLPKRCRFRKRGHKDEKYFTRGYREFKKSIDIVELIRLQKRMKIVEKVIFNPI
jgi:hypothetical protein